MEKIHERAQNALKKMFSDLDKRVLRKMQVDMHKCSAKCCENTTAGMDDVRRCISNCESPLNQARNFMGQEVEYFQDRVNRCSMDCQDKVRDKITTDVSETQRLQLREEMESCVSKCADENIKKLPDIYKKMKTGITAMK